MRDEEAPGPLTPAWAPKAPGRPGRRRRKELPVLATKPLHEPESRKKQRGAKLYTNHQLNTRRRHQTITPPNTIRAGMSTVVTKIRMLWSCCVSASGSARPAFGGIEISESCSASHWNEARASSRLASLLVGGIVRFSAKPAVPTMTMRVRFEPALCSNVSMTLNGPAASPAFRARSWTERGWAIASEVLDVLALGV